MNSTDKLFARKMFRLRIYESKGAAFQSLFEKVMGYRYTGFVPVKPYGRLGDRKNDGCIPDSGRFFQVYAPEDPAAEHVPATAAKKAEVDFEGLLKHWSETLCIKNFRFVFNDEYRGCPPQLLESLAKISQTYAISSSPFLAKDLEQEAMLIAEDQLLDVINGPLPVSGLIESIDFGVLGEVVQNILEKKASISQAALLKAPDFNEKIAVNGLTSSVAALLMVGSYQAEAITDYFSKNTSFAKQRLREQLNGQYHESRGRLQPVVAHQADLADLVFFDILAKITPSGGGLSLANKAALQEAAIVVMAFYFEACDIFEGPDASA